MNNTPSPYVYLTTVYPPSSAQPSITRINATNFFLSNGSLDWTLIQNVFSNYTEDLTGCLVNCSNHGLCSVNSQNRLVCTCFNNYTGSSCQTDKRPCSAKPCLNNAICLNKYNSSQGETNEMDYLCECDAFHYGARCELRVDLCANKTCSGNGRCEVNSSFVPVCKCFSMFSGDQCQVQSAELQQVRRMISAASVIAIVTIIITYLTIALTDLHTFLTTPEKFLPHIAKKKKSNEPKIIRYEYRP